MLSVCWQRVKLKLVRLDIGRSANCSKERISFYDGDDSGAPLIANLFGHGNVMVLSISMGSNQERERERGGSGGEEKREGDGGGERVLLDCELLTLLLTVGTDITDFIMADLSWQRSALKECV